MKAKGAGYFHIFETAWIYWVGVAEMSFCSSGHRLNSNITPTYSLLRRSYKAPIVVVNSMSPWSIIRTRSEQDNLLTLDSLDGYMLKYWWSESEWAADGAESLPNANSEEKTRAHCRWTGNKCWNCDCGSVKEWKDAVVALKSGLWTCWFLFFHVFYCCNKCTMRHCIKLAV